MRTGRLAACAALVGLLCLAGAGPAHALSRGTYRVTLPTGDRVALTVAADGRQAVTIDRSSTVLGPFNTVTQDGDVYAFPVEVAPYFDKLLDQDLFNVSKLVEQGYSDRDSRSIPVIVTHKSGQRVPDAVTKTAALHSIDGIAGRESKAKAPELGRALAEQVEADAAHRPGPLAGIEAIHLDEKVRATLADSVPQVGAPQAWAGGFDGTGVDVAVLDTGADTSHPDLEGKVAAQENFTPESSPGDGNGHGTHVAATVAGTGNASAGSRKGVAPGARLMNGKVLDSTGTGQLSWVIEGMEWAAASGAEIVSMSLGAGPSDGTDPLSQAVNDLTESTGVLFTIAAGNYGGNQTIATPGAASSALTVGAVDKSNVLSASSSRGPRLGDFAIKPDLTAPGVGIIAARAAGTALGEPVDDLYTMLSGTSMATPHVAGAAAILKQQFPTWTPQQLKSALVSTAAPRSYTVYEQGGGRVDVARAFAQRVYASGPVDLGHYRERDGDVDPVTKPITYTNQTGAPVTLELTAELTDAASVPAPGGLVRLGASTVTVPAGGTAQVDVDVDPNVASPTLYGGAVTGRSADGAVVVRTPIGLYKEPATYDLTIEAIARDGRPARRPSWVEVYNVDDMRRFSRRVTLFDGRTTLRVPAGTYSVMSTVFTFDEPQVWTIEAAFAGDPQVEVNDDTTVVADARRATEVVFETDRPTEPRATVIGPYRADLQGNAFETLMVATPPIDRVFAAPTEQVTKGAFGFRTKKSLAAPELEALVTRPETMPLDVRYAVGSAKVDGREQRLLTYVGLGRPEDFRGRDVRGKAVLMRRGELATEEQVANATAAGAAAAIIHNDAPGLLLIAVTSSEIPVLATSLSQGELLQDLLEDGPVRISLRGIVHSPYTYDLLLVEPGRILADHRRRFDRTNTVRLNTDYHADLDGQTGGEVHHAYPAEWPGTSSEPTRIFPIPVSRTEYVSVGSATWQHLGWTSMTPEAPAAGELHEPFRRYPRPGTESRDWFAQPQRPGVIEASREGSTIRTSVPEFEDPDGRSSPYLDWRFDAAELRLYEDGELIAESDAGFHGDFAVGDEPATYRAELDVSRRAPFARYSTDTETAWTFRSAPAEGREALPLLLVDYDVGDLDGLNRAPRGGYEIDLRVRRQPGAPAAAVTDVQAWASFDQGGTWSRLDVRDGGGGNFAARLTHPPRARDVSLRVQAADAGGSRVTQTIIKAYGLR